ncbi:MAG: PEP-CTERM sorting domain-containing protein [Cyanobacteriota bacterium]|nr:PEP-CTERM sorting domain-containing protein [Cyanobacteriota bacterium]
MRIKSNSVASTPNNPILQKLALSLFITTTFICSFANKSFAANFNYNSDELEIFNTEFDSSEGWSLKGTKIDNGTISGTSDWGKASYAISPVNLNNGDIFLYWSSIFPERTKTERDKYYVGLQYSDNDAVEYNGSLVDENAELKMAIRPKHKGNPGNSFNKIYIDPNVGNFSPATTQIEAPDIQPLETTDFRLKISKVNETMYEASSSYWNGVDWELMGAIEGNDAPLEIQSSDWLNAKGEIESPVTFEAINFVFRKPGSAITAVAVTQVQGNSLAKVPEPSTILGLPLILALGGRFKRRKGNL